MSDMLFIGQTGVRSYSRALDVVAENVANASTAGHIRKTTTFAPALSSGPASIFETSKSAGHGVKLTSIGRAYDALQTDTIRRSEAVYAGLEARTKWLTALQSSLTGSYGISEKINNLFTSLSNLSTDPTNLALRQGFLSAAGSIANAFNETSANLEILKADIDHEGQIEVTNLNNLSLALANLNGQIRRSSEGSSGLATLSDERDRILASMSYIVGIDVNIDEKGQATVRVGDSAGPALVNGETAASARLISSGDGYEVRIGPSGNDEKANILSGIFAGLSQAKLSLNVTEEAIDELALRMTNDFNSINKNGIDLNGIIGENIFSLDKPIVEPGFANGGSFRVSAELADGANMFEADLTYDGTSWTLTDGSQSVVGNLPLSLNGLKISGSGTARNGDMFSISPASPSGAIKLRNLGPDQIATSSAWLKSTSVSNAGTAQLSFSQTGFAPFGQSVSYEVVAISDVDFEVLDSSGTVVAVGVVGQELSLPGVDIKLDGLMAEGDKFYITSADFGEGNNSNILKMLDLQYSSSPSGTYADAQQRLVANVTTSLAESKTRQETARATRDKAAETLQLSSGVDLNTEAADMLRLQQAFQANARIIQAAREIFDTIVNVGR